MVPKQKIAVLGAGRIGQSVAKILREQKSGTVLLWDIDSEKMHHPVTFSETVTNASIIFLCVPSWALRDVIVQTKKHVKKGALFVSFAKGIEAKTGSRVDEIFSQELHGFPFAIFSGPFMAEELDRGLFGIGFIGTKEKKNFLALEKLFANTHVKLHYVSDVKSTALAGVLKNLYAVGLGIADGLNWGTNAKGLLLAAMYQEMIRAGEMLGAKKEIVMLAGGSDLAASGFSPYSRNRRTGEEILAGRIRSVKSESMATYPAIKKILGKKIIHFPFLALLIAIAEEKKDARREFEKFL